MNVLATTPSPRRGTELLLRHCAAISRPSAAERLNDELGGELSRRLVQVLAPSYRVGRRLRGSSSP
jgi:hypothetical protein